MKKTLLTAAVLAAFVSTTADARGGRGFSVRSFHRPAKVRISKTPAVKPAPAPVSKATPKEDITSKPKTIAPVSYSQKKDESDENGGFASSFVGGVVGGAVGAAVGSAAYDALTDDEPKAIEQETEK